MKIKMVCKICEEPAKVDPEKSTKNWTAYETTCRKCKGQIVPRIS